MHLQYFTEESSTMDEDMGGGEGVASSDDVNDISSAAQEVLSTGIRSLFILLIYRILHKITYGLK